MTDDADLHALAVSAGAMVLGDPGTRQQYMLDLAQLREFREAVPPELADERGDEIEEMREALERVKYWMHEPLVHHMPMRDPRKILRLIEDVLG